MKNTTIKGDSFENKVFDTLDKQVKSGEFPISAARIELFRKKKYYSRDRDANIVVDISMEFFRKGGERPFLFILMECKDYRKAVPVDDVEEFFGKIAQLAGTNVKGIMFITSCLQKGAYNYAMSKGMAVVRVNGEEQEWLLERVSRELHAQASSAGQINVLNALLEEEFTSPIRLAGIYGTKVFDDFSTLFREMLA